MKQSSFKAIMAVVLAVIIGGVYYSVRTPESIEPDEVGSIPVGELVAENPEPSTGGYSGKVLAGTDESPLLDFTEADYRKALDEKQYIVLYFYAEWCPICRAEFPLMENAFDGLEHENVIGFRVNFNDRNTDEFERGLAKEFGVAYQHTKVILENGERILKSPEGWNAERYAAELGKLTE